jgi:prevent-host-death family protein
MSGPPVNIHDAKTNLSRLLERVEAGERITIARAGTPVALLVPLSEGEVTAPLGPSAVRESVAPYRASPPAALPPAPRTMTASALADHWSTLPALAPDDVAAMARDIREAREGLPPVSPPWE